ncbi:hypothetical protein DID77_02790, partial [Candidatus Marinamargulisbacteria bacterium SCGC AG-439-L15]
MHNFHIPVMGTAFTIDSPLKVGKYGISSVISIGDDALCESMREFYTKKYGRSYEAIEKFSTNEYRSERITAYLNLVHEILNLQMTELRTSTFEEGSEITTYFELLPEDSLLKKEYESMLKLPEGSEKETAQFALREKVRPGSIDVNIMTKLDRRTYSKDGELLPEEYSDALTALKGFADSELDGGVVFSAGFNRRLYAHCANFDDFFPDENGYLKKRIILKVSDFRSSVIQGKFLAKKGLWISEHRIESGLNCGGHAFATTGYVAGVILQEFLDKKEALFSDLFTVCNDVLKDNGKTVFHKQLPAKVTYQGGIGTSNEQDFLLNYYKLDGTGWASPFLIVPEVTCLDDETREHLAKSDETSFYLSGVSPLGVPFNTVKGTASEDQKMDRVKIGRPGSPCPKGHLVSNTEFTKKPICTASTTYQKRKLAQLEESRGQLAESDYQSQYDAVVAKSCLCEDLASPALIKHDIAHKWTLKSAVCPGPNLAYFSKIASLKEMVGHIYGRLNLRNNTKRSNFLINELKMYINYIEKELKNALPNPDAKQVKYLNEFKNNLLDGIAYYKSLIPQLFNEASTYKEIMTSDLTQLKQELETLVSTHSTI